MFINVAQLKNGRIPTFLNLSMTGIRVFFSLLFEGLWCGVAGSVVVVGDGVVKP